MEAPKWLLRVLHWLVVWNSPGSKPSKHSKLDFSWLGKSSNCMETETGDVTVMNSWLVVWNMFFHILGIIIPIDELHHFSEG